MYVGLYQDSYAYIDLSPELVVAMDHIIAYFDRFGTKPCCFEDLQPYVDTFISSAEGSTKFINSIRDATHLDSEEVSHFPKGLKRCSKLICPCRLQPSLKTFKRISTYIS
jgi:hypothetical protein